MATWLSKQAWLAITRACMLRGEWKSAATSLTDALQQHPTSVDLRRAQAGLFQQIGRCAEAEAILRTLLNENSDDAASAFSLARILIEQGRTASAAATMLACVSREPNVRDANLAITAIELLDDCERKRDAAEIAKAAISANPHDSRLHAYVGMLAIQLGDFDQARQHDLFALDHDDRAWEWHVPIGLASTLRYTDDRHPDFARFHAGLQREELSELARAELHFALGKAHDDVGNYADAAHHFREGNAIRHRLTPWSRKGWRRSIETRLASTPLTAVATSVHGFAPVFIVGMPRTGTTLLAELLSRYPGVCNRGELPTLSHLASQPELCGSVGQPALARAATLYATKSRQDDAASDARWFIDKQPLNFRYIDLALAMFPDARIIHCQRDARDTALSLWMQCFLEDVQGYSYDFGDIGLVMRDAARMMSLAREHHPDAIRAVPYEGLVAAPETTVSALAEWLDLPVAPREAGDLPVTSTISTASLWQARQPVHTGSIGRWIHYAPHLPELQRRFQGDKGSNLKARV